MARHGYLREYDEGHERNEDRERGSTDRRDLDRDWRSDERGRDRVFMFEDEDRERFGTRGISHYGREHGYGGFQGDYGGGREQGGFGGLGDYREGRTSFTANPDEHYRSWRDKQMRAMDRDYAEYCREREQQFHQEFDSWRQGRQQKPGGQSDELLLNQPTRVGSDQEPLGTVDADSAATMGQAEPQTTTTTGRGRR